MLRFQSSGLPRHILLRRLWGKLLHCDLLDRSGLAKTHACFSQCGAFVLLGLNCRRHAAQATRQRGSGYDMGANWLCMQSVYCVRKLRPRRNLAARVPVQQRVVVSSLPVPTWLYMRLLRGVKSMLHNMSALSAVVPAGRSGCVFHFFLILAERVYSGLQDNEQLQRA